MNNNSLDPVLAAIADCLGFLRKAGRRKEQLADAKRRFERLRSKHTQTGLELVVDQPPGQHEVDFDVLITDARGETTMLGWHKDEGRPWSVDYASHWAANFVFSIDDDHLTIGEVLAFLRRAADRDTDMSSRLIDEALLLREMEKDPPRVSTAQIDRAERAFRVAYGLGDEELLSRWLQQNGMTVTTLREWLRENVALSAFRTRLAEPHIDAYFRRHRAGLSEVLTERVVVRSESDARALLEAARTDSLHAATLALRWRGRPVETAVSADVADELPSPEMQDAPPGSLWGPFPVAGGWLVCRVHARRKARLDEATRWRIRGRVVAEWLAKQRAQANVTWHW